MSERERQLMNQLIIESTHDGQLNLDELRRRTNRAADEEAQHNTDYGRGVNGSVRDHHLERLTTATREILGIIPRDRWDLSLSQRLGIDPVAEPTHGLRCFLPADFDANASLGSQGVACRVTASRSPAER